MTPAGQSTPDASPAFGRLEDRYAHALFALATEQDRQAAVEADLVTLSDLIATMPALALALRNPALGRAGQGNALAKIAERLGAAPLTQNFLRLVAQKGRVAKLPGIIAAFRAIAAAARDETTAEVTSAAPLSDAQTAQLTRELDGIAGAKVTLHVTIDPALIGGLSVKLGATLYDRTLKSHLNRLMLKFEEAA